MEFSASELLGRWELIETYIESPGGDRTPLFGDKPRGLIQYSGDQTVFAMVADTSISLPDDPISEVGAARAWAGFLAYYASWTLVGSQVRHTILLAHDPRLVGSTLKRDVVWNGSTMHFRGPHPSAGTEGSVIIVWRRP